MMEIDDDGPQRQKRRLQPQDSDSNRQITKSLFNFVRRGQIKEAIKMCELCDEPWQSAGLYGYMEHNQGMTGKFGHNRTIEEIMLYCIEFVVLL